MTKRAERPTVLLEEIYNAIRDVGFECFVLSSYGSTMSPSKSPTHMFFNVAFVIHINATIAVKDAPSIAAFVSAAWIHVVLHKFESDSLDFYATNRIATIEALGSLVARCEFHLSPLDELIGFIESDDNLGVIIVFSSVSYS